MKGDYFSNLPPEITINILSLLPIPAIISCKCVCKSWLCLIETAEFVESHLSKSPSLVAVFDREMGPKPYRVLEFSDESAHNDSIVFDFSFPPCQRIHSSVNGLLFLCRYSRKPRGLFVCNPVTRDYVKLPRPPGRRSDIIAFGFGVSKMTGQYKVVSLFDRASKCEVYTLGTGSWKTIAFEDELQYVVGLETVFLNGNLHWLAFDAKYQRASCFDLETEVFSSFAVPLNPQYLGTLIALEGCLGICYNLEDEIVTWVMKEYGIEESWTKAFTLRECWNSVSVAYLNPIKVFKDGDMLMLCEEDLQLYCYSKRTRSIQKTLVSKTSGYPSSLLIYRPSFLPLKDFLLEDLRSF